MMAAVRVRHVAGAFANRGFRCRPFGYPSRRGGWMDRIRIEKRRVKPRPRSKILALDPRDPDILHAKAIQDRYLPPRRRAA
jgi:hypothetical protein